MGISSDDINFSAHLLEGGIVVSCIFNFGRAVECESCWHKNKYRPLAFDALVRNGNELTVVESFSLKWLNLSINNGHRVPFWVYK
jgi:hypothetical protein